MPKGFLVKRTKKMCPVSYRVRKEDARVEHMPHFKARTQNPAAGLSTELSPSPSPTRPVNSEYLRHSQSGGCYDQTLTSSFPFQAESFLEQQLKSFNITGLPATFHHSIAKVTTNCGSLSSEPLSAPAKLSSLSNPRFKPKKLKPPSSTPSEKRFNRRDEVKESPVLGLRIEEGAAKDVKQRFGESSPLGQFICQLCKGRYSDPPNLAHHKCSRIIRVEYRCTECDKVFSCPANLASHRRWHKPKSPRNDVVSVRDQDILPSLLKNAVSQNISKRKAITPSLQPSFAEEGITFDCNQCRKKFGRQSYLRKHLALHNRKAAGLNNNRHSTENKSRPDNNALRHSAPIEYGPPNVLMDTRVALTTEMYPCRLCGGNFFSSLGLTRHLNKCHPTETREIVFLTQRI